MPGIGEQQRRIVVGHHRARRRRWCGPSTRRTRGTAWRISADFTGGLLGKVGEDRATDDCEIRARMILPTGPVRGGIHRRAGTRLEDADDGGLANNGPGAQHSSRQRGHRLAGALAAALVEPAGRGGPGPAGGSSPAERACPAQPIRFVVPYAGGGPLDQAARVLAEADAEPPGPAGRGREQARRRRQHRRRHGRQGRTRTAIRS